MGKIFNPKSSSDEGEAWIASYADLMTLLLCFFILLYSFSHPDEGKLESISQTLSRAFKGKSKPQKKSAVSEVGLNHEIKEIRAFHMMVSLLGMGDSKEAAKKIEDSYVKASETRKIQEILKKELSLTKDQLKFEETIKDDILVDINLPSDVLFRKGAELNPKATKNLQEVANSLKKVKDLVEVEIIGHTDPLPLRRNKLYKNNWHLSAARAGVVAAWLIGKGVPEDKFRISGMAHLSPLFPNYDSKGKSIQANMKKNRRIEIRIKRRRPETKGKAAGESAGAAASGEAKAGQASPESAKAAKQAPDSTKGVKGKPKKETSGKAKSSKKKNGKTKAKSQPKAKPSGSKAGKPKAQIRSGKSRAAASKPNSAHHRDAWRSSAKNPTKPTQTKSDKSDWRAL